MITPSAARCRQATLLLCLALLGALAGLLHWCQTT